MLVVAETKLSQGTVRLQLIPIHHFWFLHHSATSKGPESDSKGAPTWAQGPAVSMEEGFALSQREAANSSLRSIPKSDPWASSIASPGNMPKMQVLRFHQGLTDSETLALDPVVCVFKGPGRFWCRINFKPSALPSYGAQGPAESQELKPPPRFPVASRNSVVARLGLSFIHNTGSLARRPSWRVTHP